MTAHLGFWTETTARLRSMEERLLVLWRDAGYAEVIPPTLLPAASVAKAAPPPLLERTLSLPGNGGEALALRSDFTTSVAWLASRRLPSIGEPVRIAYRGGVLRRPAPGTPDDLEAMQAGCERLDPASFQRDESDEEVARLAGATLRQLGLRDAVLELGHWGIVGPLLEALAWPAEARASLEGALDRKSLATIDRLGDAHGRPRQWQLLRKLLHLGGRPEEVDALDADLEACGVAGAWHVLRGLGDRLAKDVPGLVVRLEATDIRHWTYYTGLTVKAFAPALPHVVLSGGRYDGVYPALGRPFSACGFAVHLGRLLTVPEGA